MQRGEGDTGLPVGRQRENNKVFVLIRVEINWLMSRWGNRQKVSDCEAEGLLQGSWQWCWDKVGEMMRGKKNCWCERKFLNKFTSTGLPLKCVTRFNRTFRNWAKENVHFHPKLLWMCFELVHWDKQQVGHCFPVKCHSVTAAVEGTVREWALDTGFSLIWHFCLFGVQAL